MSYASIAAPTFPMLQIPVKEIQKAVILGAQSLGLAAALWFILAAPGFVTDRTALRTSAPVTANR